MSQLADQRIVSTEGTCTDCQVTITIQASGTNTYGSMPPEKDWNEPSIECPVCGDLLAPDEIVLQGGDDHG